MPNLGMKALAFALLAFASIFPLRADILANSNFADGRAHWKGDAEDIDSSGDLSNSSTQGGVTITLKKDRWTKIYQTFTTRAKKLHYSITFTLGSDYDPIVTPEEPYVPGAQILPTPGLDDIPGVPVYYAQHDGSWMAIIAQSGRSSSSFPLRPDVKKSDPQTFSGPLRGSGDDEVEMNLVFAFPPGDGTITITNISLTDDD
jgi:hypothetical protein